jgi:hypothetical protein
VTTLRWPVPLRLQPGLEFLKRFSVAAHEKPTVLKTDGDTPIVADFRYFPDFISQSEFALPGERFGKEFDPITYLETIPFHFPFAFSPSSTRRRLFRVRLRVRMANTVRFNFRAIKALSIFKSSNAKSCASSGGVHGRLAGRGPSFILLSP